MHQRSDNAVLARTSRSIFTSSFYHEDSLHSYQGAFTWLLKIVYPCVDESSFYSCREFTLVQMSLYFIVASSLHSCQQPFISSLLKVLYSCQGAFISSLQTVYTRVKGPFYFIIVDSLQSCQRAFINCRRFYLV